MITTSPQEDSLGENSLYNSLNNKKRRSFSGGGGNVAPVATQNSDELMEEELKIHNHQQSNSELLKMQSQLQLQIKTPHVQEEEIQISKFLKGINIFR